VKRGRAGREQSLAGADADKRGEAGGEERTWEGTRDAAIAQTGAVEGSCHRCCALPN
jgi:hypothetical protein